MSSNCGAVKPSNSVSSYWLLNKSNQVASIVVVHSAMSSEIYRDGCSAMTSDTSPLQPLTCVSLGKNIIFRVASKEGLHPTGLCSYVFPLHIILECSEIWQVYATRDNEDVQISRAAISKSSNRSDKSHRTTQYTYAVNQPKCELFTKYRDSKTCMHANF